MADEQPKKEKQVRRAGQIIRRGKDKYLIRIFLGRTAEGKRRFFNKTFHGNKTQAETWLRGALVRHANGEPLDESAVSFSVYLDDWLQNAVKSRVRRRTYDDYAYAVERWIKPALGKLALTEIKPLDLQKLYNGMLEQGLSARTVELVHTLLYNAFDQAIQWEKLASNPAMRVKAPKKQKSKAAALTAEQARELLAELSGTKHATLFQFAIETGLRSEEYCALQWKDIDWQAGSFVVMRVLTRPKGGGWYFDEVKTNHSRRTIPLSTGLLAKLKEHRQTQLEARLLMGKEWKNHDLVFCNSVGDPVQVQTLRVKYLYPALDKLELPRDVKLHGLRHTMATMLMGAGVNPKIVSERMWHSSVKITLDIYSHVQPGMQREATDQMASLLNGSK